MARSLNKVTLIGNLTRDPELRYTPSGVAVTTFSVATNRQWQTDSGEKKEDVEFHRVVAWNKLAEICAQLLAKGRKVYIEGRLQTREWTTEDNLKRTTTEVVATEMILLDSKGAIAPTDEFDIPAQAGDKEVPIKAVNTKQTKKAKKAAKNTKSKKESNASSDEEDIPF